MKKRSTLRERLTMPSAESLGGFEELVLLTVYALGDSAYGVTVQERLEHEAERAISLGAVYASLDRLEVKGYLTSTLGDATPQRGGRRKRHFAVTADGVHALERARHVRERILAWRTNP